MKKHSKYFTFLIGMTLSFSVIAQRNCEKADRYFNQNQFETAIKYYQLDVNSDSKKAKEYAMAKLADCYRIIGEFEKAEEIYRKILKRKKTIPENYLNYALSLKSSAKYAEAKLQFEEYIKMKPDDPMGKLYLQSCDSAQKWFDEALGKEVKNIEKINTMYSDFGTCLNNNKLSFSSSRKGSKQAFISFDGGGEIHRMDVYQIDLSSLIKKEDNPKDIKNIEPINSSMHEGNPTFTADGNEVYFTKTVKGTRSEKNNNIINVLQVFYSKKDSLGHWTVPVSAFNFNSDKYSIGQPCITADGQTIFYMSDMPGGFGKTDIYYSTKTPGNKIWSKPKNLGSQVNTFGHELFPTISTNNILYFSSDTHPGMGQLDIFKADLQNGSWTNIQNMKPPINSISNDFAISFDESNSNGFFSSDRFNGKGAEDIYSFSLEAPLQFYIYKDSFLFKNNFLFDDIKYKIINETDSTTQELSTDSLYFNINPIKNNQYSIILKKNGMQVGKIKFSIQIEGERNYYAIISENFPFKLQGKFVGSEDSVKLTRNKSETEEIVIKEKTFEVPKILQPQTEYKLFL